MKGPSKGHFVSFGRLLASCVSLEEAAIRSDAIIKRVAASKLRAPRLQDIFRVTSYEQNPREQALSRAPGIPNI